MGNSITITKCSLLLDRINVNCFVETETSPLVLGCTFRDPFLKEYDVQHIYINESKEIELDISLNENQIDLFNEKENESTIMLALWKDDSFTERIFDTGWVKIEFGKTSLDELIDNEELKKTIFKMMDSDDFKNLTEDLQDLKAEEYFQEIYFHVFVELGRHLSLVDAKEIEQMMKNDEMEKACKLILDKIPSAKEISKSALIKFRESWM